MLYPPELRGRNLIEDNFCCIPGNLLSSFVNPGQSGLHEFDYKIADLAPPVRRLPGIRLRGYFKPLGAIGPSQNERDAVLHRAGVSEQGHSDARRRRRSLRAPA